MVRREKRWRFPPDDSVYCPWDTPGFVKNIKSLEQAGPQEAVHFVRRYGFLGYPEERAIGGEPLGWLRHQGRRMRYLVLLFQALFSGDADPVMVLCEREGFKARDEWLLPRASDAFRLYIPWAVEERREGGFRPPENDKEWLTAIRNALRDEFRALTNRVRLGLVTARWRFRGSPQPFLRLRWDASLLDTVLLGQFLGTYRNESPRLCPICATPYVSLKADCGDRRCEMDRKKRQQRLQSVLVTEKLRHRRARKIRQFFALLTTKEIAIFREMALGR